MAGYEQRFLSRQRLVLVFILTVTGLFACRPARMAVSPELAERTIAYEVRGRGGFVLFEEDFQFGPFRVDNVKRSWTTATALTLNNYRRGRAVQEYEFTLRAPDGSAWNCGCGVNAEGRSVTWETSSFEFGGRGSLYCIMQPVSGGAEWRLSLHRHGGDKLMRGHLFGTATYDLIASNRLAETSFRLNSPAGYGFWQGNHEMASVETINEGVVRLPRSADSREVNLLATAAAALLLHNELNP